MIGLFEDCDEPMPLPAVTYNEPPSCSQVASNVVPFSCIEENNTIIPDHQCHLQQSAEISKCKDFVSKTCGCTKADGKPCSTLFTEDHYADLRAQATFLTREQLDLVILGSVMATMHNEEHCRSWHRHKPAKRQKTMMAYMHHGYNLCKTTYNFLHGVGNSRVKAIRKSYLHDGLTPRIHGNAGRYPHNALTYIQISNMIKFIQNYAEQHAILLPGRIPSHKRDDLKLLPSSDSKKVT